MCSNSRDVPCDVPCRVTSVFAPDDWQSLSHRTSPSGYREYVLRYGGPTHTQMLLASRCRRESRKHAYLYEHTSSSE